MAAKRPRAVALKYELGDRTRAPQIMAKGVGTVAERILDMAKEKGIPLYADPELVEVLGQLDVGHEIQPELYQAVAEVLIYLYKMNQKKKSGAPAPRQPVRLAPLNIKRK